MLSHDFLATRAWSEQLAKIVAADGPAKIEVLSDVFSAAFQSDELMLFHFRSGRAPKIMRHRAWRVDREQQISEYKTGFYMTDPIYLAIERAVQLQVLSLRDVVDQEEFENSDFYKLHYGMTRLADELCYCVADGMEGYVLLSFARSDKVGPYAVQELDIARILAPIVVGVLTASLPDLLGEEGLASPSPEELKLHQDLKKARDNFGRSLLTLREYQVVQMMLRGYPIDLISSRLNMAEGTTKVHRRNIYRKLDISSKAELFSLFLDVAGEVNVDDDSDPLIRYEQAQKRS